MSRELLRKALEQAWRTRYSSWLRHAWHVVGNKPDAEDVVQDAVCRSLQAEPSLDDEKEADAYLHAAIRSISHKYLRRRGRSVQVRSTAKSTESLIDIGKSPFEVVLAAEQRREEDRLLTLAQQGMEELPAPVREALELMVLRETPLKMREVAEIQGVSITTVHRRVRRAYDTLRALTDTLGGRDDDDQPGETP
jgi:RNA polymerase sigma factor (sigma-70 family)